MEGKSTLVCNEGGSTLKVVYASTPEQQERIQALTKYFYTNIFPEYFSDQEIFEFEQWGCLSADMGKLSDTLKESYQIISSLEILIEIIETGMLRRGRYQRMFTTNSEILAKLGVSFPFTYRHFLEKRSSRWEEGSMYRKAANVWLI